MNKVACFLFIMTMQLTFAQLSVRNNAYVYVNNMALYVEDDVNIEENTAYIYLRNGSQLLQGSGTTGNSGQGRLSVFQTGTSNTYMYNYWCSPVGINSGSAGNTVFTPNVNFFYETAAPISSSPFGFITGYNGTTTQIANYWLYTFTGTTAPPNDYQDWEGLGAGPGSLATGGLANGTLASGYGFTMKGNPSGAQKYDFRGRPNNGTITTTLNANRETLVGNPYPSAIDARDFIHDTNNAAIIDSGTLSFWEQDPTQSTSHVLINYVGGYATYTIDVTGTVETFTPATFDTYNVDGTLNTTGGGSTSGKNVYRYIPIGQGFMVKGNGTGGTLRTTNAMRVFQKEAPTLSEFFRVGDNGRTENQYNEEGMFMMPDGYKRFRLNIDFDDTYTRQLTQNFHHTATAGEDYGLETISPARLSSDVYWPNNDKAYNAQAFSFDVALHIPLVLNINRSQLVRFRLFDIQNFDESQPIYLHDMDNDLYVDLRTQNYELNLDAGNYANRFEITFTSNALSTEDISIDDFTVYQNNNLSELHVLNPNQREVKSINLFDVNGKQLFTKVDLPIAPKYEYSTKHLSEGVYIVKITFESGQDLSKKIIVANKQ
ncbi:hypothetical protein C1T31_12120 [Hanstruepera neustonica]|uniref:Secretion system C-terminal sorting domain-containing protein n=1 Tax=Hanstruepera neustonica TaxID=1445657 RepID=A0A2K1DW82_9FLAO|nr:T9SS type A sorting domain-containing protein [Hanstruepera neustonica]PNQ72294.1 hypothetical protein C1T31_12120 [Hanstruepera neustonica]